MNRQSIPGSVNATNGAAIVCRLPSRRGTKPKRGRGRPRKNPKAPPNPPRDPNAPKRGRGRPRKNPSRQPPSPPDPWLALRARPRDQPGGREKTQWWKQVPLLLNFRPLLPSSPLPARPRNQEADLGRFPPRRLPPDLRTTDPTQRGTR